MERLPTVMLEHITRTGRHYDWLMGLPGSQRDPESRLWAARTQWPTRTWRYSAKLELTPLPLHRTVYLNYQGPLTGNRGVVRRIDTGDVLPLIWTRSRMVLDVRMQGFSGQVEIHDKNLFVSLRSSKLASFPG